MEIWGWAALTTVPIEVPIRFRKPSHHHANVAHQWKCLSRAAALVGSVANTTSSAALAGRALLPQAAAVVDRGKSCSSSPSLPWRSSRRQVRVGPPTLWPRKAAPWARCPTRTRARACRAPWDLGRRTLRRGGGVGGMERVPRWWWRREPTPGGTVQALARGTGRRQRHFLMGRKLRGVRRVRFAW